MRFLWPASSLQPLYSAENTRAAYQLNWSTTVFLRQPIPPKNIWLDELCRTTEKDQVRILEFRQLETLKLQFLISTQPQLAPSQILQSVKGRLQHLIQATVPKAFQRNYGIYAVGEANQACLNAYVAKQTSRHPMADSRIQQRLEAFQFFDEAVSLVQPRLSSHGQYLHNLHLVFENREHLHDVTEATLQGMHSMIIRCCRKKQHLLARIGLVSNHVHLLLGCGIDEAPQAVAMALMNNLAYQLGQKHVFEFSYYVGTFGPYDRDAVRKHF